VNLPAALGGGLGTIGVILAGMGVVSLLETVAPLQPRGPCSRAHLAPNLALTFITFATNFFLNGGLVLVIGWSESSGFGFLHVVSLSDPLSLAIVVLGLDFSFYVTHVAMHLRPGLWRFHRVHHSDTAVDVTTTIRQHPGEGVVRLFTVAVAAVALGASPSSFAAYRLWSALNGLLEHANLRVPPRLDSLLSLLVVTPNMHKVHHSRASAETDTNFGNITSLFDRLFSTFTPARRGADIDYGLDGLDDAQVRTTAALLALPFRSMPPIGEIPLARPAA